MKMKMTAAVMQKHRRPKSALHPTKTSVVAVEFWFWLRSFILFFPVNSLSLFLKMMALRRKMDSPLRRLSPLFVVVVLIVYEARVPVPSCKVVAGDHQLNQVKNGTRTEEDLKVMMVSNLLLLGSEAGFFNIIFTEYHLSRFFKKSFEILKPDMLIVLGDVSAKGEELGRSNWLAVIHQFHKVLGPFLGIPLHVILGDRDVGGCSGLNARSVDWISSSFPGLDSAGCGAFRISNISFVSLNAVALICGNNILRFSVEGAVERESVEYRKESEETTESMKIKLPSSDFGWRKNTMASGSGPVLLLHIPMHHSSHSNFGSDTYNTPKNLEVRHRLAGAGPYDLSQTLPVNATEYIFQALKPKVIFSAHTHEFCNRIHPDGTREITVPAMSWYAKNHPGFIVATFRSNGKGLTVRHCALASASHVLIFYTSILIALILTMLVSHASFSKKIKKKMMIEKYP